MSRLFKLPCYHLRRFLVQRGDWNLTKDSIDQPGPGPWNMTQCLIEFLVSMSIDSGSFKNTAHGRFYEAATDTLDDAEVNTTSSFVLIPRLEQASLGLSNRYEH